MCYSRLRCFLITLLWLGVCVGAQAQTAPAPDVVNPLVPQPTDQPPPDVALPDPLPLGRGFLVNGAVDLRARNASTGRTHGAWVNALELDLQHPITSKDVTKGNLVLQIIAEDPPDAPTGRSVQLGEAYLLYKLPIETDTDSTAYLKAGQFQIPFGLLAVYDPHLLLIQPLYAQSLGLRTDFGVGLSGRFYGFLNYDLAITSGDGPNHLNLNPNGVVTFRLGRTFVTRNGKVNVGGSLLQGRLPITDIDANHPFANEIPPSGQVPTYDRNEDFVNKSRIAGDITYLFKNTLARGEALVGADQDKRILGFFAEGEYRFSGRTSGALAHSEFVYPQGSSSASRDSLGLTYAASNHATIRGVYETLRDVPRDQPGRIRHRLTLQLLLRF